MPLNAGLSLPVFGEGRVGSFFLGSLRSRTPPDLAVARPPSPKPGRDRCYSPNTKTIVALERFRISGDFDSELRALRNRPEAIATYCLPSTE
jgi:hypothetical protein